MADSYRAAVVSVGSVLVALACAPNAATLGSPASSAESAPPKSEAPPNSEAPTSSAQPAVAAASAAEGPASPPSEGGGALEAAVEEVEVGPDEWTDASSSSPEAIPAPPDVAAPPPDARRTKSGLAYKLLAASSTNDKPRASDRVTVHYTGWTTDGRMFDSSVVRGEPSTFVADQLIDGFTEGLQLMNIGDKIRLWIPEQLAYRGAPGAPAGTLVFDVELFSKEATPQPPSDVARAPASAKRTASGLRYKILERGSGNTRPKANDTVTVHYTGWTTAGEMFDSSVMRGDPFTVNLQHVIPGWSEGVQLLAVGDSVRLWIPGKLAYGNEPRRGIPTGTLVFDVTLLELHPPGTAPSPDAESPAEGDLDEHAKHYSEH